MDNVDNYVKSHKVQTQDAKDFIEEFADEIHQMHGLCLDIGCGPGAVLRDFVLPKLPADARVVGSDISKKMIDYARTAHASEKRLSFIELNVETEELPSNLINVYDNVVSFYCIHWCQNPRRAFENIYAMLRPGGKALVLFLSHNSGFDCYLKLQNNPKYLPYMKDASQFIPFFQSNDNPRATLKKILEESGFEVLHCSNREKGYIYKNIESLKQHISAVNPFITRMPVDLEEQYINDLTAAVVKSKITFINTDNGSKEERKVLDRYCLLHAYFKKPFTKSYSTVKGTTYECNK